MRFLNGYRAPAPLPEADYHLDTPPEEYDVNCCYTLPGGAALKTDGVKLVPIIVRPSRLLARSPGSAHLRSPHLIEPERLQPSLHARALYNLFTRHPQGYQYLPYNLPSSFAGFLTFLETRRREPGTLLFAVYDLGLQFEDGDESEERAERVAGIVGILKSAPENRMTEIGCASFASCVMCFPFSC
jgi:hypothetical protein